MSFGTSYCLVFSLYHEIIVCGAQMCLHVSQWHPTDTSETFLPPPKLIANCQVTVFKHAHTEGQCMCRGSFSRGAVNLIFPYCRACSAMPARLTHSRMCISIIFTYSAVESYFHTCVPGRSLHTRRCGP